MGSLRPVSLAAIAVLLSGAAFAQTYGVGRPTTAEELKRIDITISPTGEGLPDGHGTPKEGAVLFQRKAASPATAKRVQAADRRPRCNRKKAPRFPSGTADTYCR